MSTTRLRKEPRNTVPEPWDDPVPSVEDELTIVTTHTVHVTCSGDLQMYGTTP